MSEMEQEIRNIEETPDLLERALKLAGLVTRLFREAGWDEIRRLARLPSFNVAKELDELEKEVTRELNLEA